MEAWTDHIAVLKPYRGKGLAAQLRYHVFQELRKRGVRRVYASIAPYNLTSLRSAQAAGYQSLIEVDNTKVFRSRKWRCKRLKSSEPF